MVYFIQLKSAPPSKRLESVDEVIAAENVVDLDGKLKIQEEFLVMNVGRTESFVTPKKDSRVREIQYSNGYIAQPV